MSSWPHVLTGSSEERRFSGQTRVPVPLNGEAVIYYLTAKTDILSRRLPLVAGRSSVMRFLCVLVVVVCAVSFSLRSQEQKTKAPEDYLFAWVGDEAHKGNDFLAVIDADPASASYGHLVTTLATDQQT